VLRGNHKRFYLLYSNENFPIEFAACVLRGSHKRYLLQFSNKNLPIELREMNNSGTTKDNKLSSKKIKKEGGVGVLSLKYVDFLDCDLFRGLAHGNKFECVKE
jgi:hypothetical protein